MEIYDENMIIVIEELISEAKKEFNDSALFAILKKTAALYESLQLDSKKKIKREDLYFFNKNIGLQYFNNGQYEKALIHLKKARNSSKYATEESIAKHTIENAIVTSALPHLDADTSIDLDNMIKINYSLLKQINNLSPDLQNKILFNQSLLEAMKKGEEIRTEINFEILPAIPLKEKTPIKFYFNNIEHELEIEIQKIPSTHIESKEGYSEVVGDKFGLIIRSDIKLTISKFIDLNELVEIKTFSQGKFESKILLEALNALNYLIGYYRMVTSKYWINSISPGMIRNLNCEVKIHDQVLHSQYPVKKDPVKVSSEIDWLTDNELTNLEKFLEMEEFLLWQTLLLDAKDYFLRRNFRETIYTIDGALENYIAVEAKKRLDEETFNKLFNSGGDNITSVYQVLKECNEVHPSRVNVILLNLLVNKIREQRNSIVRGRENTQDLELIAFEAIKTFEKFINIF